MTPVAHGSRNDGASRFSRRSKITIGAILLTLASITALGAYGFFHWVSVVRYTSVHDKLTVEETVVGGYGKVLVTNKGFALYMFPPDHARHVTCTGGCAFAWPPLKLHAGETVVAGKGVRADLLGTLPNPSGGRVVTYHGWPLYTYLGDASSGQANGQGKNDDGGYWFLMHPSGRFING